MQEGFAVAFGLRGFGHGEDVFVAGAFAFVADLAVGEPDEGVEPEEGLGDDLGPADEEVAADPVDEFVEEDIFEFFGLQRIGKIGGKNDAGAEEAEEEGAGDMGREEERWRGVAAEAEGLFFEEDSDGAFVEFGGGAEEAGEAEVAEEDEGEEEGGAGEPEEEERER